MKQLTLEVYPDHRWAEQVGFRWVALMERNPGARLCLPTGTTPRPLYARSAPIIDFSLATVFLLDEFGLPPDDPARCDRMLERDFLGLLADRPAQVHGLNPQALDLDVECRRFEGLVDDGGVDLTLLGLGGNGHLGLNEPGSEADSPTRIVTLESTTVEAASRYGSQSLPEWGMTLGLRPILASRAIWLLVTGAHKGAILERVMAGPIGPDVPATYLRTHPNAVVLADQSAAEGLALGL